MDESHVGEIREASPDGTPPARPVTGHRCIECDEVDALLGGRRWTDVADDFPQYCHDAFPLLTPAAKIYYVPAYMCCDIGSPGNMAGLSIQSALERGDLAPAAFTSPQRAVILRWARRYYQDQPEGHPPEELIARWQDVKE